MKFFVAILMCAVVASAARFRVPRNVVEDIIRNKLEEARPSLANLAIESIDLTPWGSLTNLAINQLETFVIAALQTDNALSINIKNLTLTWDNADASTQCSLNNVEVPEVPGLILNGVGDISGSVQGAWVSLQTKNGLTDGNVQIKEIVQIAAGCAGLNGAVNGLDNADSVNEIINSADFLNFINTNLPVLLMENKDLIRDQINAALAG